jgi:hypothetical protein
LKEWHELMSARAFWVMLFLTGPLVGVSFISAIETYGELSRAGGTGNGVGEAFSPLIGIWSPTFSAYEIIAAFLLPFVAIRVATADRQSGALKLEMQHSHVAPGARILVKAFVLLAGWGIASLAGFTAMILWTLYGGHTYGPEIIAVLLGHLLNAALTIALAICASALVDHPSTAAILTLGFTVGTWVVSFVAAVHGGIWDRLAAYTPPVMVAGFQHGLVDAGTVAVALLLVAAGLAIAAVWFRIGTPVRQRTIESFAVIGVLAVALGGATLISQSWDTSENRYNSFSIADEETLERIRKPLAIEVHLAPEDPRRQDLERHALSKLRRVMSEFTVHYVSSTSTGLFEQADEHYGEIRFDLDGKKAVSRTFTAEGVLENIFALAQLTPPPEGAAIFRGHPLAARPRGAAAVFYVLWPALILGAGFSLSGRKA